MALKEIEIKELTVEDLNTPAGVFAAYRRLQLQESQLKHNKEVLQDLIKGYLADGEACDDQTAYAMLEPRKGWEYDVEKFVVKLGALAYNMMEVKGGKVTAAIKSGFLKEDQLADIRTPKDTVALVVKIKDGDAE